MQTNGEALKRLAEERGIPLESLERVQQTIAKAEAHGVGSNMARLMLRHGRLDPAARAWLEREYSQ